MNIKAKFPGVCAKCGGGFAAGAEIDWTKGKGSSHVKCAAKALSAGVALNSAPVRTPQSERLTDEQALEILAKDGRQFMRPLPIGKPTLQIGYKVSIDGKEVSIGTCGEWVGTATECPDRSDASDEPACTPVTVGA